MNYNDENQENNQNPLTEDELRELNLYAEQKRQESLEKYGRDIYDDNKEIGSKKAIKRRNFWDKVVDIYLAIRMYVLFAILIFILAMVWGNLALPHLKSLI